MRIRLGQSKKALCICCTAAESMATRTRAPGQAEVSRSSANQHEVLHVDPQNSAKRRSLEDMHGTQERGACQHVQLLQWYCENGSKFKA